MNLLSAVAVAKQDGRHSVRANLLPGNRVGEAEEQSPNQEQSPCPPGKPWPGMRGEVGGEQGPSGPTHKGLAAHNARGGRPLYISVLSPPRLVSISLMLFTSSPNLSKEYDSHVFRFI